MISVIARFVRWTGVALLGVTVLIAPWCLGSIHASVQQWLFLGVTLSLICALVTLLVDGQTRWKFPLLLVPILLLLLLVGLQLRPHDHATLLKRSPKVAELRELLLPASDSSEYAFTKEMVPDVQSSTDPAPTSIYPAATRHQLSLFVLVVSAFYATTVLFRDRLAIILFGMAAAVNGSALALLGIFMRLNPQRPVFFVLNNNGGTFSTFLNRNNAAGYLGMCLGLAAVFLLWYFFRTDREIEDSHRWDKRFERAYMTSKQIFAYKLSRMLSGGVLSWALLAAVLATGILISMSRGGSLAMAVAILIVALVVFATRRFKLSILAFFVIGLLGLTLIFWVGMDERVYHRLESIFTGDNTGRPRNWSNAIDTARDFQWRGSGFGTYQYANLLNDEFSKINQVFVRAENQYIEFFLDLGVWGLLLLLACLAVSIALCWRLIWQRHDDWLTALGSGLLIVILTQAVASLFDFGLCITANSLLLAVCCGILCAVVVSRKRKNDNAAPAATWLNHVQRGVLLATGCLFLVLLNMGHKEIRKIHRIDLATERLAKIDDYRSIASDELNAALAEMDAAVQDRPDDAVASRALAEARINAYRRAVYLDLLAVSGSRMSEDDIWAATSLISTHASVGRLRRIGIKGPIQVAREQPAVDEYLRPAFVNLARSRQSNPMAVGTHFMIAELVPLLDKDDRQREFEQRAIERITVVAPLSAAAWYETGVLERNLGHSVEARACWKHSLTLSRLYLAPIVQMTKGDLRGANAATVFQETFPDSPELYLTLVNWHFTQRLTPDFYEAALERLKYSCETAVDVPEAELHYYRGRYELMIGQYESAIRELNAACMLRRTNHEWRYYLAQAYYQNRQFKDAEREIKLALFYLPGNKTYMKLQNDIRKAM